MTESGVSKRVEEALFYRLKQRAFQECQPTIAAYGDCCRGRIVSMVWACRAESSAMNVCVAQYTSQLEKLKQRWIDAGGIAKSDEDWDRLLDNLVD